MCGIGGILNLVEPRPIPDDSLRMMIQALRHRGPDEFGTFRDLSCGLASARLSIVDLSGGQQPIANEDESMWIVFNGEIFNYIELRPQLEKLGHRFTTQCDTEVVLHAYEEFGPKCLNLLNGQFAIAIWDKRHSRLFLARDRLGIRPLYYTQHDGQLLFASEIKAILGLPGIDAVIDPVALQQVFTFWSVQSPRSIFQGILEVPPGQYLIAQDGKLETAVYWAPDFEEDPELQAERDSVEALERLLIDATQIRLRADVPVGAYLSGGMDSSLIAALICRHTDTHLETFSIGFTDPRYDESAHQRQMAQFLGTTHHELFCTHAEIGRAFPDVIWHTETPILRTAPAPMFLLSRSVHERPYKVVLTGEGADEVLAGYDIFKEARVRRFWAKYPDSPIRPLLLQRLYSDIPEIGLHDSFRTAFFRQGLTDLHSPHYSHMIRWSTSGRNRRFLAEGDTQAADTAGMAKDAVPLPDAFKTWKPLAQAQYLEMVTFLAPYLLSSQGDRVSMAHSVEGRYPFLDYRVVEFCNRLPADYKQRGMREKWLLRKLTERYLPPEIVQRTKRPYRAPIQQSFFGPGEGLDYVAEVLSPEATRRSEYFNPAAVEGLVGKARAGRQLTEVDEMAIVGILSTELLDRLFVRRSRPTIPDDLNGRWKIVDGTRQAVPIVQEPAPRH